MRTNAPPDDTNVETVLITGASSGIGWELAKLFAKEGCRLILVARREGKLADLAKQLREDEDLPVPILYPTDLSEPDASRKLCDRLRSDGITVDILVNNAGFGERGRFSEMPLDDILAMARVNMMALMELTRRLTPGMVERRRGGVLNVASVAAYQAGPHMAVYFATKAFVLSLSEALYAELEPLGVTVTCLAPGVTKTGFAERASIEDTPLFSGYSMSAEVVAKAGHHAFRHRRQLVVPGAVNWILTFVTRFLPRPLTRAGAQWLVPLPAASEPAASGDGT